MRLYSTRAGQGPNLVLLHGWGLHSGVWQTLLPLLTRRYRVTCIDLPGHGLSPWGAGFTDLTTLAQQIDDVLPDECSILGWSLGGQAALELALRSPERVRRLLLVATTPRFVAGPDWPHGMAIETLNGFAQQLTVDYKRTVQEFLSLQVRGDENQLATLRQLRNLLTTHGEPERVALTAGLAVLRTADLRAQLPQIGVPTLVIAGEHDRLTPPEAARELASLLPQAELLRVPRAAHAPFLSHRDAVLTAIYEFLPP
jgi:pimeloyl-[acyl-carrier protein] methyl ester esterase